MIPALVQWEVTERCPYRCVHCYLLSESLPRSAEDLPDATMLRIAEMLVRNQLFFVTLTGGEPLTRRQLVVEITRYLHEHGILVSLNTCLAPLDDRTLADLAVHHYLISCPSSIPERYAEITGGGDYPRFERNLRAVLETGAQHTVNMVVSQRNRSDIRTTARRMAELGVRRFAATPVSLNARSPRFELPLSLAETKEALTDLVWASETLGLEVDVMEALPPAVFPSRAIELGLPFVYRSCQAGQRNGTIAANGDVRPCGHNPATYGNVLTEALGPIWDRLQGWRQDIGNEHRSCLACDIQSSGGCPIDAFVRPERQHIPLIAAPPPVAIPPRPVPLLTDAMVLRPCRTYLERPEGDGWLVSSGRSRDILHVNDALRGFLHATRTLQPTPVPAIAESFGTNRSDPEFLRVLRTLVEKHYLVPTTLKDDGPSFE